MFFSFKTESGFLNSSVQAFDDYHRSFQNKLVVGSESLLILCYKIGFCLAVYGQSAGFQHEVCSNIFYCFQLSDLHKNFLIA